jgi:TonB family protein
MKRPVRGRLFAGVVGIAIVASPALVRAADDSLAAARDLYAAAAYEDALATLNRLGGAAPRADESRAIEQYRALCLLALGRSTEAERAIEAVVIADPLYRPNDGEVSPRVRTAFADVRRRMLPSVVQQRYAAAKAAFDKKDYPNASRGFGEVLQLFADSDLAAAVDKPPLSDLRTLSLGFRDLTLQALAPPPAPTPPPAAAAAAPAPAPVPVGALAAAVRVPAPAPPRVFSSGDNNVAPPAVVRQEIPAYRGVVPRQMQGVIEVVIDEKGTVTEATMRMSVNPSYDRIALQAASQWRYKPAMLDGEPVKFRKMIQITLKPGQ